jgi:hypothetical protein
MLYEAVEDGAQALRMADEGVPALYPQNMEGNEPILATS